jgi:mRNA interferase HigB
MRLVGRDKLNRLASRGPEVEKWVRSWVAEVSEAHWRQANDVTHQFPNAHDQGQGSFIFPIPNHRFAIKLRIAFAQGIALISDLNDSEATYGT